MLDRPSRPTTKLCTREVNKTFAQACKMKALVLPGLSPDLFGELPGEERKKEKKRRRGERRTAATTRAEGLRLQRSVYFRVLGVRT